MSQKLVMYNTYYHNNYVLLNYYGNLPVYSL